jgi:hypothetical protein
MRIVRWGLATLLALPGGIAAAQQAQPTQIVAEAAKRSRELKKDSPKATHHWDDDTVPKSPNEVSVVGQASASTAPGDTTAAAAAAGTPAGGANAAKDSTAAAQAQSELNAAMERLKNLTAELDLLTREYDLERRTYYGKTNYSADTDGAEKLKREEIQIEAKKQEVADAQKKVDEVQAKAGEPAAPPAPPPAAPAPPAVVSPGESN